MQMKGVLAFLASCALTDSAKVLTNPVSKVLTLLDELAGKIGKDGKAEAAAHAEYAEWCDDTFKNTKFAIETAGNEKQRLEAAIGQLAGNIAAGDSKIEELSGYIAADTNELKDATMIREKEASDFSAGDGELMDVISTLDRAITILQREMAKNPAAFAQMDTSNMAGVIQGLTVVLNAAAFSGADQKKLMALVQSSQSDTNDDLDLGAPAAATYKTHSTGILDVLEDLKDKAEAQLSDLRKAEVNTKHNFEMLKQSLEDQIAADTKDMVDEKAGRASSNEGKAVAEGDLKVTIEELTDSQKQLAAAEATCARVKDDHEATVKTREEELAAIAQAKEILNATTSGATSQTYSLLQSSSRITSRANLAGSEVVAVVKRLAKQQHSAALAQLASRISAVLRFGSVGGDDPFAKVKGLIESMISKLEKEAGAEATEKAYCDEQMAKTEAKKNELEDDIAKMTSKVDQNAAKSAQLKQDVQTLQGELAALAKAQAEMGKIRQESHADFVQAKADLELGLSGVRQALSILREYYGSAAMIQDDSHFGAFMQQPATPELHSKAGGAGGSIIDILEVIESDFAKNLAKEEMEEDDSQNDFEKLTQENSVTRTVKDQAVKYKSAEAKSRDKTVSEYSADRENANAEYAAVMSYWDKIRARCIAKPQTYETRSARRAAEIQGLKEALSILEDETAFVQHKSHGHFRGSLAL